MSSRVFLTLLLAAAVTAAICSCRGSRSEAANVESGPLLYVEEQHPGRPLTIIDYGDMRFTNPVEKEATNPRVRRWLVSKIASEHPDAVFLSGDVPWHGGIANDYAVYREESKPWRENKIIVLPALGNHEFSQASEQTCLQNWWTAFPELHGRRFYSAQIGNEVYGLNLDTELSLVPGSKQAKWIESQLAHLPHTIKWVFINLHHPPVADVQVYGDPSHNPRPNEIALAEFLKTAAARSSPRYIVIAGHIHNYERFSRDNVVYLVSGGGGAKPRPIIRSKDDLFQDTAFPNYHYIKFVKNDADLDAVMIRIADPNAPAPAWETKDHFRIPAKR